MALQIKRVTAVTADPNLISGVDLMITLNQTGISRESFIGIEKIGNDFQVMYIHDTALEGGTTRYGLIFADENVNLSVTGNPIMLSSQYIGKFDLSGNPKHVFLL